MTKKCFAIVTVLCLLAAMLATGVSAAPANAKGEFQIFCVPDAHQAAEEDINLIAYIASAIEYTKEQKMPLDLIVFLGAAVTGPRNEAEMKTAIEQLVAPVVAANIPYAVVFGNGDSCPGLSRKSLLQLYIDAGGGLCVNEDAELFADASGGITNFKYEIEGLANLFFFDRGSKDDGQLGERYVRADQVEWFKAQNDKSVPALVFQHIPVPEIYEYMLRSPFNWALPFGWSTEVKGTNYLSNANLISMVGTMLKAPKAAHYTDGQFDAFAAAGNVKGVLFGNNPQNNYIVNHSKGIQLVQLPGAAWNGAAGSFMVRGGSFVRLYRSGVEKKFLYTSDLFTYRQASRVRGSEVQGVIRDASDFFTWFSYVWQTTKQAMIMPIRGLIRER